MNFNLKSFISPDLDIGSVQTLSDNFEWLKYYVTDISTLPLSKFPILAEFIVRYEDATNFKEKFRRPANDVQKILLRLISNA